MDVTDNKKRSKRKKRNPNSRTQRNKDKERKRKERTNLHRGESNMSDNAEPSTSRYQKLYKENAMYRENKKSASKEQYKNIIYQTKMKESMKRRYRSNIQFQRSQKNYIRNKYKTDIKFQQAQKDYIKNKYKTNIQFRQVQKDYMENKYRTNIQYHQARKDYMKNRYRTNIKYQQAHKDYITKKYASHKDFQHKVKIINLLRYRQNVLYREKMKQRQCELYRRDLRYREKKILHLAQKRRNDANKIAIWFRMQVRDGPAYICSVCIKYKFRKQVIQTDHERYVKQKTSETVARQCLNYQFKSACTSKCPIKCKTINHNLWICYTCHRHLLKGQIPADAYANGLQLQTVPDELKVLNKLEKQLISLRIPFMKLVQLPKGNQRGIIGPCVSIPTDIQKTVNVLPLSDDDTQLIRCKLKRKQSYTGHCQYEFVNTSNIYKALHCLKDRNPEVG